MASVKTYNQPLLPLYLRPCFWGYSALLCEIEILYAAAPPFSASRQGVATTHNLYSTRGSPRKMARAVCLPPSLRNYTNFRGCTHTFLIRDTFSMCVLASAHGTFFFSSAGARNGLRGSSGALFSFLPPELPR